MATDEIANDLIDIRHSTNKICLTQNNADDNPQLFIFDKINSSWIS